MGIGALYYALKAAEALPKGNVLKQSLWGIISWMVFTSTIVHGITIPLFLLGSAVNPGLHPKFLIQYGGDDEDNQEVEKRRFLAPLWNMLAKTGLVTGSDHHTEEDEEDEDEDETSQHESEATEQRPLLRSRSSARRAKDAGKGKSITRREFHRIMVEMADPISEDNKQRQNTREGGRGNLNAEQKEALLGKGSGLNRAKEWDLSKAISVYDEGDVCVLTDGGEYGVFHQLKAKVTLIPNACYQIISPLERLQDTPDQGIPDKPVTLEKVQHCNERTTPLCACVSIVKIFSIDPRHVSSSSDTTTPEHHCIAARHITSSISVLSVIFFCSTAKPSSAPASPSPSLSATSTSTIVRIRSLFLIPRYPSLLM